MKLHGNTTEYLAKNLGIGFFGPFPSPEWTGGGLPRSEIRHRGKKTPGIFATRFDPNPARLASEMEENQAFDNDLLSKSLQKHW